MNNCRSKSSSWAHFVAACFVLVVVASTNCPVECQFLQPQSHLSRLVQSITSPLVMATYGRENMDPELSSMAPTAPSGLYNTESASQHENNEFGSGQLSAPATGRYYAQQQQYLNAGGVTGTSGQVQQEPQHIVMQQAPSQQRGVPTFHQRQPHQQTHYNRHNSQQHHSYTDSQGDEDSGAPSQSRYQHERHNSAPEYHLGAYLGPTIDDKEIQGAFNSNADDKDDDDMGPNTASGYDHPNSGRQRAASSSYSGPSGDSISAYGPPSGSPSLGQSDSESPRGYYGRATTDVHHGGMSDDDSGADDDDAPPRTRPMRLSQAAASQYEHRNNQQPDSRIPRQFRSSSEGRGEGPGGQQLVTAANGYAPYGQPIDLNGILNAAAGGNPGGYEVYQGDGGYPGSGYWQGQRQGNGGRSRQQAASALAGNSYYGDPSGYYNGPPQSYAGNGRANNQRGNDNDDQDADADED